MNYVHIVAILAVLQFFLFGILVGRARKQHGVKAPATSGHELFERALAVAAASIRCLAGVDLDAIPAKRFDGRAQ